MTESYVLTLKLNTSPEQDQWLAHVFWCGQQIYNVLVRHCRKQLRKLILDPEYRELLATRRKDNLSKKDKNRKFYEELFVKLATRVAGLQHPDGFWHASLLDPASYPSPETSCTTFIVYSIAYGINEGLLDKEIYLPVMIKGWNALVSAVEPNGKLGYVQQIGADPKKVTRDMTEVYGVGAFLMAGNEIYKMAR